MEYVPAIDLLGELNARRGSQRVQFACAIGCQILEALRYAHRRGFVHRDVKPTNVLLMRFENRMRSKLADFGLAKNFECGGFSGITRRGDVRGSLPFMPPEQIARVLRLPEAQPVGLPLPHVERVSLGALSPDGKLALTNRLWSTSTGRAIGPVLDDRGTIASCGFTADGRAVRVRRIRPNATQSYSVPQPDPRDAQQIARAIQSQTGIALDSAGDFRVLSRVEWENSRKEPRNAGH